MESSTMPKEKLEERVKRFFEVFSIEGYDQVGVRGWRGGEVRLFPYAREFKDSTFYGKFNAIKTNGSPEIKILLGTREVVMIEIGEQYYEVHQSYVERL